MNATQYLKEPARWVSVALWAFVAIGSSQAADPEAGRLRYAPDCARSGCHGSADPVVSPSSKIQNGRNAMTVIDSAITNNTGGMNVLRATYPSGGTALQNMAAYLANSPTKLSFASTALGSTSAAQTITVRASPSLNLSAIAVTTSAEFTRSGGTCGTTLGNGASCTIGVTFSPAAIGTRTGTLSLSHNRTPTPIVFALSGVATGGATAPVAAVSPGSLGFASTTVGVTTAAQSVTVSNTGNAPLSLSAISSTSTDFLVAGGTCSAGGSVAAGGNCTVSVSFRPTAAGARSGTLNITHNAAGGTLAVSLSGTGTAPPAPTASATPTSLSFGSRTVGVAGTAQMVTLSNGGNAALVIGTIAASGDFAVVTGGTCANGASIAAGATCTVNAGFTPTAAGARSGTLTITHNAAGGSTAVSLSGTGVAATPSISVSPTTLSFNATIGTSSPTLSTTISNTGTAALSISGLTIGGASASEFARTGGTCSVGGSVAAGSSCTVTLGFTPTGTAGARTASLSIAHNAVGTPTSVTLNGTATATPQPAISVNQSSLSFASQVVGTTSASQTVTVSNSGTATLNFSGIVVTGTHAADFQSSGTCSAPGTLTSGASCTVVLSFTPGATGARTATLTLNSDASNGAAAVSLSGTGAPVPVPAVTLSVASLAFGNQTDGTTSAARVVTLRNTGTAALAISSITANAPFAVSHACPGSLAAAASCNLNVTFAPPATGPYSGSLSIVSNAAGSPHGVALSGTGVVAVPALAWSPATGIVSFTNTAVGSSSSIQSLTLLNQGPGPVTLQQIALAGAQAAEFSVSGGTCTASTILNQGGSCTLVLGFQPDAAGLRQATLQIGSNGANPPDVLLSGTGSAPAAPLVSVSPSAISISGSPQLLTLTSSGSAPLQVQQIFVSNGSFTVDPAPSDGCPTVPFTLMPAQSCSVLITWTNSSAATESGMVEVVTDAATAPVMIDVQAQQAAAAVPMMQNVGSGGCSIARGDAPTDPVLWILAALAAGVLWRRRRS